MLLEHNRWVAIKGSSRSKDCLSQIGVNAKRDALVGQGKLAKWLSPATW